jgi:tRNA-Thr(GGU) m(6)t(6)A37 methyltransferase TsaA
VELVCRPIGFVRSGFKEKADAPRQGVLAEDVTATIELAPEYQDALDDLSGFERIWVLFWFDRAEGWKPKVQPPRSDAKRGLFATRSPHRPNPIGMTAVRLDRIEGTVLHIRDIDLIDGTPVLDLKPYIAYADAFPDATQGWLGATDPKAAWEVDVSAVEEPLAWIAKEAGFDLRTRVIASLKLGPQPHAYRRIKGDVLAVKEWRAAFRVDSHRIVVEHIFSGFREKERPPLHEAFVARFPAQRR